MELDKEFILNHEAYPYHEELDDEGYSYIISFAFDDREGLLFICECGAHIEWFEPEYQWQMLSTTGEKLFGPQKSLNEGCLKFLIWVLSKTQCDVELLTTENIIKIYENRVVELEAKSGMQR